MILLEEEWLTADGQSSIVAVMRHWKIAFRAGNSLRETRAAVIDAGTGERLQSR